MIPSPSPCIIVSETAEALSERSEENLETCYVNVDVWVVYTT
jgi:hypothetical protein